MKEGLCARCGEPMSDGVCLRCRIVSADKNLRRDEAPSAPAFPVRSVAWPAALAVLVAVGLWRLPAAIKAFEPPKDIRDGAAVTDSRTDACIRNLWGMAARLQSGGRSSEGFMCPVAKKPYRVTESEAGWSASCPDPLGHGYSEISVSERNPVPRLR